MSLREIVIACDWPGCGWELDTAAYHGCLSDRKWKFRDSIEGGPHLCPDHRFKTWAELESALVAGQRTEEEVLREKVDATVAELDRLADLLADSEDVPVKQTPAVQRLNEIIEGLKG